MPVTERDLSHEVKTYNRTNNKATSSKATTTSDNNSSSSSGKSPKKKHKTSSNSSNNIQTLIKIDNKQPFDISTSAFTIAAERCIQYNTTAALTNPTHANNTHSIDELVPVIHDSDNELGQNHDSFENGVSSSGILEPTSHRSSDSSNDKASLEEGLNSDPTTAYWSPAHSVDIDLTASDTI